MRPMMGLHEECHAAFAIAVARSGRVALAIV